MICEKIAGGQWRLSFTEPEGGFLITILARLGKHYQEDLDEAIESGKVPAEIDLLDIREAFEAKIAQIPHSRLIPLAEFSKRMHELDSAREIWLYCKDGARSGKAWKLLYDAGFRKIKNVAGGIDAWSEDIDPETPRY